MPLTTQYLKHGRVLGSGQGSYELRLRRSLIVGVYAELGRLWIEELCIEE